MDRLVEEHFEAEAAKKAEFERELGGGDITITQKNKAQERKATPVFQGVLSYFPDALKAVARVSAQGNVQHGLEGEKLTWQKDLSNDHEDALTRHLIDHSIDPMDDDGHLHLTKVAWRALAALQIHLEDGKV